MKEILKQLRKEKGMTQEDVSKLLGITKSAYGYYEQGKTIPDANGIVRLAQIFDTTSDYILGINKEKQPYFSTAKQSLRFTVKNLAGLTLEEEEVEKMTDDLLNYLELLTFKYKKA